MKKFYRELDDRGFCCAEDALVVEDFTSSINDYDRLSHDAPTISEWKSNAITEVSLEFNGAVETMCTRLHDEISHITQKISV